MRIAMIAAMANNRVIGKDNQMPWHLPADLKHFKKVTLGKPVIMGRKTYQSIGKALPGRRNIVISRQGVALSADADWVQSIEQALALVQDEAEVMIIGGAEIYRQVLPMADRLYITDIDLTPFSLTTRLQPAGMKQHQNLIKLIHKIPIPIISVS
jgi:dihydrofolate reductase